MGRISDFFKGIFRSNKTKMLKNGQGPTEQKGIDYDKACNGIMEEIEALEKKYTSLEDEELRAIYGGQIDKADQLAISEDQLRNVIRAKNEELELLKKMQQEEIVKKAISETQKEMAKELKENESLREAIRFEGVEPPNPTQNGYDIQAIDDSRGEK